MLVIHGHFAYAYKDMRKKHTTFYCFSPPVMAALASNRSLDDAVAFGCQVAAAKISNTELPAL